MYRLEKASITNLQVVTVSSETTELVLLGVLLKRKPNFDFRRFLDIPALEATSEVWYRAKLQSLNFFFFLLTPSSFWLIFDDFFDRHHLWMATVAWRSFLFCAARCRLTRVCLTESGQLSIQKSHLFYYYSKLKLHPLVRWRFYMAFEWIYDDCVKLCLRTSAFRRIVFSMDKNPQCRGFRQLRNNST